MEVIERFAIFHPAEKAYLRKHGLGIFSSCFDIYVDAVNRLVITMLMMVT